MKCIKLAFTLTALLLAGTAFAQTDNDAPKPVLKQMTENKPAPKRAEAKQSTPKPIAEDKSVPVSVAAKESASKPVAEEDPAPTPVAEEKPLPAQTEKGEPEPAKVLIDKATLEHILCVTAAEGDENVFLSSIPDDPSINLNISCDQEGHTPLQFATSGGFVAIVKKLLNLGAKIDSTSLLSAIHNDNMEIVKLFIYKGAELCIPLENNTLGYAASQWAESKEMKKLLLAAERRSGVEKDLIGICSPTAKKK